MGWHNFKKHIYSPWLDWHPLPSEPADLGLYSCFHFRCTVGHLISCYFLANAFMWTKRLSWNRHVLRRLCWSVYWNVCVFRTKCLQQLNSSDGLKNSAKSKSKMACGSGLFVFSKFKLLHELYCYALFSSQFFWICICFTVAAVQWFIPQPASAVLTEAI